MPKESRSGRQSKTSASIPRNLEAAVADEHAVGFVEIHIEQGPVLEAEDLSVAAVTSIVGQTRLDLKFIGHANHAGTTPMHLRHDALAAAAEWIAKVEALARQHRRPCCHGRQDGSATQRWQRNSRDPLS